MVNFKRIAIGAVLFLGSAPAVYAGSAVTGVGSTPTEAMNDANARARDASIKRWGKATCMTHATYERCRKDDNGYWVCTAYVANEQGSCW
jgi:hypothetical protein